MISGIMLISPKTNHLSNHWASHSVVIAMTTRTPGEQVELKDFYDMVFVMSSFWWGEWFKKYFSGNILNFKAKE